MALDDDRQLGMDHTITRRDFLLHGVGCDPMVCSFLRDKTFGDARVPFGNITIANTDSAGICGTGLAIHMAARVVDELKFGVRA